MQTIRVIPVNQSLINKISEVKKTKVKLTKVDRSNRLKESGIRRGYDIRSDEELLEIRRLYESKEMKSKEIQKKFNLSKEKFYQIIDYTTRGHLVPGIWKG